MYNMLNYVGENEKLETEGNDNNNNKKQFVRTIKVHNEKSYSSSTV